MSRYQNPSKIAKQLALLLSEQGYELNHTKEKYRNPVISDHQQLHNENGHELNFLFFKKDGVSYYLECEQSYHDGVVGFSYDKVIGEIPKNGYISMLESLPINYYYDPELSEEKAKEAASVLLNNIKTAPYSYITSYRHNIQ
jgi:hypothetical protein